jgi:murein DD-endopeptidase MepM/ murein hydrolase activator NlpD
MTAIASPTPTATPAKKKRHKGSKNVKRQAAPAVKRRLTSGGFAFPVYGKADVADDFGGPREIGPHQGNDVFAEFGAPVVAVTDGTISKVGTLPISGNRLWVTSTGGDAFFYAHLSAFSPAAVNGATVKAGTVLGFVGNTGDAEPTPPHLHFEVHPGGEPQDAVDPHPILLAWQGREDVAPGAWLQHAGADTAERPGALVAIRDFIAE